MNEEMKKLIQKYLNNEIDIESFSYDFPSLVYDWKHDDVPEEIVDAVGDISEACCNYEPNDDIRAEDEMYLNEKQVRKITEEKYNLILNLGEK
ncbi:hypothetical protein P4S83_11840 [Aneurinibacillus thermoaerophilus]|uniref:hypothetical protein n=1 Tax=Aneurinibacillus thermoaerophilus TaxID=143495 RepID=UPI002E22B3DA|nr:hypothetical protein [Aneurinibacillus thermoaerophilus]MED0766035.1 hypothetical protein [Aneurinibacillus thermoaerophilus]